MSAFFQYRVDGDTMRACLSLVERHAAKYCRANLPESAPRLRRDGTPRRVAQKNRAPISPGEIEWMVAADAAGVTRKAIAAELNTTMAVVSRHLRRRGIVARVNGKAREIERRVEAAWRRGLCRHDIAAVVGRSYQHVCEILRAGGARRRAAR